MLVQGRQAHVTEGENVVLQTSCCRVDLGIVAGNLEQVVHVNLAIWCETATETIFQVICFVSVT